MINSIEFIIYLLIIMMKNLLISLIDLLKQDTRLVIEWELSKAKVQELAFKLDADLIKLLLTDKKIKEIFFKDIGWVLIFDNEKFVKFVNNKEFLPDSFTSFKNKIWLVDNKDYLLNNNDVVLNWPYKDCILAWWQDKEDSKRDEIFYNEILARDEIDVLLDRKAFTNFKKIDKNWESELKEFKKDSDWNIKDNLLIKWNNLLALHSLKKKFAGKIKLIYIDPPYNTWSDSFWYNDRFNHSSWLTFIKNRLDIAKKILNSDWVIAVQCSFHEYPYLKVLMDEIYDKKNYKCTFHIKVRHPDRILTWDKEINDIIEYILFYSKNINYKFPKKQEIKKDDEYVYQIELMGKPDFIKCWEKNVEIFTPNKYKKNKILSNSKNLKTISIRWSIKEKNSSWRFYVKYIEKLRNKYPPLTLFKVPNMWDDIYNYRYFHLPKNWNKNGTYFQWKPTSSQVTIKPYSNFYDFERDYNIVAEDWGISFRNWKKPESLLFFLIDLFTKTWDIVLDYHLWSWTTSAVAHKMWRQYIWVEQMDYVETISKERMKKVIEWEQGGISKNLEWKGWWDFVYIEIAKKNNKILDEIEKAKTSDELKKILENMEESGFINYKIKVSSINENIKDFEKLNLEEQKQFLLELLDKNQLFLNFSEINDEENNVNEEDKKLNNDFYN